jgi:hypothetical protein
MKYDVSLRESIECPKDSELFDFEFNPDAALLLFHENGGLDRFNCNGKSTEETSILIKPTWQHQLLSKTNASQVTKKQLIITAICLHVARVELNIFTEKLCYL